MRCAILSLALVSSMTGCANTNKGRAVQLVMASDAIADEVAGPWEAGVNAQIDHCKSTLGDESIKEKREECMGIFGKGEGLEAATQTLVSTQTAIKEAVKCEELKTCPKQVDWAELKEAALNAWSALKPYYDAIKKGN
jgi:hypothetical protein